jgi:phosphoglycerate dehydrogenase-like enzyme
MLFMVIEHFKSDDPKPVRDRFVRDGRMMPEGVMYHASWVDPARTRCFQVMEAEDIRMLDAWTKRWADLIDFEIVPVMTSREYWATAGENKDRRNHVSENLLVLADPAEPELSVLDALPGTVTVAVGNTVAACERAAPQADVILNCLPDAGLLERIWPMARRVRWVHSRSAGVEDLLFPALVESPVPLTNARGAFSGVLAEFAIGAVLFFAKDFRRLILSQMAGEWDQFDITEIRGQTLGLVGYGDIGRAVASRAHALGMKVLALRRRPELSREDPDLAQVFSLDRKHEMLAESDYVVVVAPLTPQSRGTIGEPEFAAMKPGAVLINIGRGPVVDQAALVAALERGRIHGAALDVFDTEPLPPGHPFYNLGNVLLSPHSADHTPDWKERSLRLFLENFARFGRGEPLLNVVNKKLGY